jgi:hypothetical protein
VLNTRHPSIHKSWHCISWTSGGHLVGIVLLWTKDLRVSFLVGDNRMAALSSVTNEVYRCQWKADEHKINLMVMGH